MKKKAKIIEVEEVVVKFAGDSGDGMQFTGSQFSDSAAFLGNDLSTFPDYPAEIRAPEGTIAGVSGFFAGIIGVLRSKERSVLVFIATVIGFLILVFVSMEFLSSH